MAKFFLFIFFSGCLFTQVLDGQVDTVLTLQEVAVSASRLRAEPIGVRVEQMDSSVLQNLPAANLADALQQHSLVFIKSYGLGSLATTSMRGGNASHTAIVWNGFPIQSPMLGQVDLALFPIVLMDEVQVQYGSSSALWGSGAIGGALHLNNRPNFGEGLEVGWTGSVGSFGQFSNSLSIHAGSENLTSKTQLFHQQADNDFSYHLANGEKRRQMNAAVQQYGGLQENYVKLSPRQQLAFRLWWQQTEREIPPTTAQARSVAEQEDAIFRTTLDWQWTGDELTLQARTGLFQERIHFEDELSGEEAPSESLSTISEAEAQWQPSLQHRLHLGLYHSFTTATSEGYPDGATQQQWAILAGYSWTTRSNRLRTQLNVRQGFVQGNTIPFVPAVSAAFDLTPSFLLNGQLSRSYRFPTFNDLYWQPGGNPNLLSESGWNEELMLQFHRTKNAFSTTISLTVFNRNIDNWILWQPPKSSGQGSIGVIWVPQNIANVWSRGVEQRVQFSSKVGQVNWKFSGGYDWLRSTQKEAANADFIGKQLIYVPQHQLFAGIDFGIHNVQVRYQHHFTSKVFILSNNTKSLPGYDLGYLNVSYSLYKQRWQARIFCTITNVWNVEYRAIENRRMPGSQLQVGCTVHFKKH